MPRHLDPSDVWGNTNLQHVLLNDCTDADCELHNPEVGYEEEVVSTTEIAFFLAGAFTALDILTKNAHGWLDKAASDTRRDLREKVGAGRLTGDS